MAAATESVSEVMVIPSFGLGHLFPCIELCKHLASRNLKATLVVAATRSADIPLPVRRHPLIHVVDVDSLPAQPPEQSDPHQLREAFHRSMAAGLARLLSAGTRHHRLYAVLDDKMSWSKKIFAEFGVPVVTLFTSGASAAAIEHGAWKSNAHALKPGEVRRIPGLPDHVLLAYSDLKRRPHPLGPPPPSGGRRNPGDAPPWVSTVEDSAALLFNTCDDLEGPFLDYIAGEMGKPAWGVGPLLPAPFWESLVSGSGSTTREAEVRPDRESSYTPEEVVQWLESKPRGSVLYVSFGSEVGPTLGEYPRLADALEESNRPFVWVVQPGLGRVEPGHAFLGIKPTRNQVEEGYYPDGLAKRAGERGLIIRGWAPQLLILSHRATAGFLSHCGWNSTVEALGKGVPLLAWPIRGDQYYNAKLVVSHLRVGHAICDDWSRLLGKQDIAQGIERLMSDEELKQRAEALRARFPNGFPATSVASLNALRDFFTNGSFLF